MHMINAWRQSNKLLEDRQTVTGYKKQNNSIEAAFSIIIYNYMHNEKGRDFKVLQSVLLGLRSYHSSIDGCIQDLALQLTLSG